MSEPTSTSEPSGCDLATAIASLVRALEDQSVMSEVQAQCAAERWIDEARLQHMKDAGFFDDDLAYVDQDKTAMTPEIENAATSTVLACATAA